MLTLSSHFEGCGDDNESTKLVYGGTTVECQRDDDKINCHGDAHDIVKYGYYT